MQPYYYHAKIVMDQASASTASNKQRYDFTAKSATDRASASTTSVVLTAKSKEQRVRLISIDASTTSCVTYHVPLQRYCQKVA